MIDSTGKRILSAHTPARKIAIYGRPSSGKTCILSALAMARLANPLGYSCVWLCDKQHVPDLPDNYDRGAGGSDPLVAKAEGKKWIRTAMQQLERGGPPAANEAIHFPYRLLYQFTTDPTAPRPKEERDIESDYLLAASTYKVELIDYSGESANPDNTDRDVAKKVMEHIEECDGLIILAEVPLHGQEYSPLYRELTILVQALMLVAERRKKNKDGPFPTALALNKWDRTEDVSNLIAHIRDAINPGRSKEKRLLACKNYMLQLKSGVNEFFGLVPPVPHHGLTNVLRAVAGGDEYFRIFPLSALGPCRQQAQKEKMPAGYGQEVPIQCNPLMSFALEDPFVWLCQRADQIALARLETHSHNLSSWNAFQLISGATQRHLRDTTQTEALHPPQHPYSGQVRRLRRSAYATWWKQLATASLVLAASLILLVLGAVSLSDASKYHDFGPALQADAEILPDEETYRKLSESESFLRDYGVKAWYRWGSYLFVLKQETAEQLLPIVQERLRTWEEQSRAQDGMLKELDAISSSLARAASEREVEGILASLKGRVMPAKYPKAVDTWTTLVASATTKLSNFRKDEVVRSYRREVDARLESNNYRGAAQKIREGCSDAGVENELRSAFRESVPKRLSRMVVELCRTGDWKTAISKVEDFSKDESVRDILGEEKALQANSLVKWIMRNKDEQHYIQCVRHPDDDEILDKYLQNVPDGEYGQQVRRRLDYIIFQRKLRNWKISVTKMVVKKNGATLPGDRDATAVLYCGEQNLGTSSVFGVNDGKTVNVNLTADSPPYRLDDTIKIKVSVTIKYTVGSDNICTAEWSGKVQELLKKDYLECILEGDKRTSGQNRIHLSIDRAGVPIETELRPPNIAQEEPTYK